MTPYGNRKPRGDVKTAQRMQFCQAVCETKRGREREKEEKQTENGMSSKRERERERALERLLDEQQS